MGRAKHRSHPRSTFRRKVKSGFGADSFGEKGARHDPSERAPGLENQGSLVHFGRSRDSVPP